MNNILNSKILTIILIFILIVILIPEKQNTSIIQQTIEYNKNWTVTKTTEFGTSKSTETINLNNQSDELTNLEAILNPYYLNITIKETEKFYEIYGKKIRKPFAYENITLILNKDFSVFMLKINDWKTMYYTNYTN